MVCYAQPQTVCTAYPSAGAGGAGGMGGAAGACADDEMCAASVTECHEELGAPVCVPRHVPPCSADADCGPGFSCEEAIAYECSGGMVAGAGGSGGTAGAGSAGEPADTDDGTPAGMDEPDVAGTCTEQPTGQFYCQLQAISCESDADCPGTLECLQSWGNSCWGTAGAGGGVAGAGTAGMAMAPTPPPPTDPGDGAGGHAAPDCEPMLVAKTCAPVDYFPPPGGMGAGGQSGGTTGGYGGANAPPTMNPNVPGPSAGAGGAAGTGGGEAGPSDGEGDDDDADWFDRPRGRFGCAVAGDDATDALWNSLGLIGLVALVLRRHARTTI
jgi:MYXO-CTERM domain-containing protein